MTAVPGTRGSNPDVRAFFDEETYTVSYVVSDPESGCAAIIDPVLDFDPASGRTSTASADALIAYVSSRELDVEWILETHVHADHLTAASYLNGRLGGRTGIGARVCAVQKFFAAVFNFGDLAVDGSQFDHLFDVDESFAIGSLEARALSTPGHTAACVSYVIGNAAFVGDTLFMPDYGTARADFPGGNAETLYDSIQRLLSLPDDTRLYLCHDYKAPGRNEFAWETTVRDQRERNIHVNESVSREEFVRLREARDSKLAMPRLILPAVQVNIRGGLLPRAEDNGIRYLKIPLNAL